MRLATNAIRIRPVELKKRRRQIEAWYPYEAKAVPSDVGADRFFVTDRQVVGLVEDHLMPAMPAALFFSGTYRVPPQGRNALETVLADFKRTLDEIGHDGRYFAVAHRNEPAPWDKDKKPRVHVHAIIDYSPALAMLGDCWGDAHGIWKAGLADPGGHYYVARHATDGKSLVLDRTSASVSSTSVA